MKPRLLALLLLAMLLVPQSGAPQALAAAPTSAKGQPQRYRLSDGPDVASWLLLYPDGHFAYMLSAGALDEQAEGTWTRTGDTIRLTTVPRPKPAEFSLAKTERVAGAPFSIKVTAPNGRGIAGVDLRVTFEGGGTVEGYTQEYGWSLDPEDKRVARSIELGVPMYGLRSKPFAVDGAKANTLSFVLIPNDLGVVDFDGTVATVNANRITLHRFGQEFRYVSEKN